MAQVLRPKGDHSLIPGENVIRQMHPHWATLAKPTALATILSAFLYSYFHFFGLWFPDRSPKIDLIAIVLVLAFSIPWVISPYVKWATTMYLFTDQRIITRTGLFNISGEAIPLSKINSIQFTKTFIERLYGSGSLVIESAARNEAIIKHVRGAENIQREVYELMSKMDESK